MQFKQTLVRLLFILLPFSLFSQTTYLLQDAKENILAERMEILGQKDSILNFSKTKPLSRKQLVTAAMGFRSQHPGVVLSKTDEYNLQGLYRNNLEYLPENIRDSMVSKKPIGKNFYRTPANLYEVHVKDFNLIINPVFQFVLSKNRIMIKIFFSI